MQRCGGSGADCRHAQYVQVTRHLIDAGHVVHIVTGAPENVFRREIPSTNLHVRKVGFALLIVRLFPLQIL